MKRRISKGRRAHLLALCEAPGTITFRLRDRATSGAKKAVRSLKKFERAMRHEQEFLDALRRMGQRRACLPVEVYP